MSCVLGDENGFYEMVPRNDGSGTLDLQRIDAPLLVVGCERGLDGRPETLVKLPTQFLPTMETSKDTSTAPKPVNRGSDIRDFFAVEAFVEQVMSNLLEWQRDMEAEVERDTAEGADPHEIHYERGIAFGLGRARLHLKSMWEAQSYRGFPPSMGDVESP